MDKTYLQNSEFLSKKNKSVLTMIDSIFNLLLTIVPVLSKKAQETVAKLGKESGLFTLNTFLFSLYINIF